MNPDYLHMKKAFLFEFRRPLSDREKAKARSEWLAYPASVQRVLGHKLPKAKGGISFQPDPMCLDIPPGDLRIVDCQTSIPEVS